MISSLIFLLPLASAETPVADTPTPPDEAVAEVEPCPEDLAANLAPLREARSRHAYDCLAAEDGAAALLIEVAAQGGEDLESVTRALTIWRLLRLDEAIEGEEARTYNPADRRLLMDGIRAHRGRRSPSESHARVLEQFPWYDPIDTYTENRLRDLDRNNIKTLESPPPPPPPETEELVDSKAAERRGTRCFSGCSTAPPQPPMMGLLLGVILLRRRLKAPTSERASG